jgi:CubicO group peptidase (beta-lactamase class C family)
VRRITGKTLGTFLRDEVAGPLGADFHIGMVATEDRRIGELVPPTAEETAATGGAAAIDSESLLGKATRNPPLTPEMANTRAWRAAEIPAANGHGNARSVARVLAALACGGTLDGVRRDTRWRAATQ